MGDASTKSEKSEEQSATGEGGARPGRPDRAGVVTAAVVLAACGGLLLFGLLSTGGEEKERERAVPSASVTYEVTGTGTADITYQARSESGTATVVKAATLPWRKTVPVPLGRSPVVSIVLGETGGQARCAVAIQGRHLQSATASGDFGRATCTGVLPAAESGPESDDSAAG
ncbi:hypothetical protein [Streptomyces sp. NPDC005017]|uniref:hypothetical protein n=1 Tax=Streptomyces sp. NPDC005017 TaxID=3364706 RepID=UPI00367D0187